MLVWVLTTVKRALYEVCVWFMSLQYFLFQLAQASLLLLDKTGISRKKKKEKKTKMYNYNKKDFIPSG